MTLEKGATTLSIMTFSIMTVSIITHSIKGLFLTLSIKDTQHEKTLPLC
jgi:hypothetical protein